MTRITRTPAADAGFTLIETLIATLLTLFVTGTVLSMANARSGMAAAQPEMADMQQRARAAAAALLDDLLAAGTGTSSGADAGSLGAFLPPIVPRRMGLSGADAPGVVRADAVTLVWIPDTWKFAATGSAIVPAAPTLSIAPSATCAAGDPLCGFAAGDDVIVYDDQAHFSAFRLLRTSGSAADLQLHDAGAAFAFSTGARVAPVTTHTFYLDSVAHQLRLSDGYATDTPVIDNVVGLNFTYFGDPNPPVAPKPAPGTANCLYDAAGHPIAGLATLTPSGGSLAPLPLAMLNDGPWCGEGGAQFDADLLRIRRVRVTLRVQAGPDMFRASGGAFAIPGTSRRADESLPDYVTTFDVAPRNLAPVR